MGKEKLSTQTVITGLITSLTSKNLIMKQGKYVLSLQRRSRHVHQTLRVIARSVIILNAITEKMDI